MDILNEINKIVTEFRGEEMTLKLEDDFSELGFDSLDRVELVMALEEKFDITFPDDIQVETVKELIAAIENLKK